MGTVDRADLIDATTIAELVDLAAERHGERAAVVDHHDPAGPRELSFVQVRDEARAVALTLISVGVQRGDRVAIWSPNSWRWIVTALGVQLAGAAVVPVNTRFKGAEAAHLLEVTGARVLFAVRECVGVDLVGLLDQLGPRRQVLPELDTVVVMDGASGPDEVSWDGFLDLGSSTPVDEVDRRAVETAPDDLTDISFTSGTTGRPKGVRCTHTQLLRSYRVWCDVVGLRAGDRYLIVSPFFHAMGSKAGFYAALIAGATSYPVPVFRPDDVLGLVERDRISVLPGPPTLFQTILGRPDLDRFDRSSLRLAVTGSASIPVELIVRMRDELGFERVVTGYGLTEATGIVTMCRWDDDPETIARTAGRPLPGVEVRIVGPSGDELGPGEEGEVLVRGYNVTSGYWHDPAATDRAIVDGWLHTGDVGVLEPGGSLRITDRLTDMFIVGGFNAYPAEIENILGGHPDLVAAAVVGVPDDRLGEVGRAFVVPRPGVEVAPSDVVAWCRSNMANYKVPRFVDIVAELPTNAAGKVLKADLRSRPVVVGERP